LRLGALHLAGSSVAPLTLEGAPRARTIAERLAPRNELSWGGHMRAARFAAPGVGSAAVAIGASLRLVALVVAAVCGLSCGGCLYARMLYYNTPTLSAADYFDSRVIAASPAPLPL